MEYRALDSFRAEAFSTQMMALLNQAMLALMVSIGHKTGLFDAMRDLSPATAARIAGAAGLLPDYVREWLAAMVTGGIVDFDARAETYSLPAEHAACITRAAGPANLASFAPYIAAIGAAEDRLVECFRGAGAAPDAFDAFERLQERERATTYEALLLDQILPLGGDLAARLEVGIDVLDVSRGGGSFGRLLARTFPASRVVPWNPRDQLSALGPSGRSGSRRRDLSYDLATVFDSLHRLPQPGDLLGVVHDALRPGGVFLGADLSGSSNLSDNLDHPLGAMLYAVSTMGHRTESPGRGGVDRPRRWGAEANRRLLASAGFEEIRVARVAGDVLNCYYVARRPRA